MPKTVNKVVYAKPFAMRWDAGDVWLLAAEWNQDYIDEVCLFPQGRQDDQVDASATAFHELASASGESVDGERDTGDWLARGRVAGGDAPAHLLGPRSTLTGRSVVE